MTDTMTDIITHEMEHCERLARREGWDGDDFEPTYEDLDCASDRIQARVGRYPTSAEWADAGYPVFENADYCSA